MDEAEHEDYRIRRAADITVEQKMLDAVSDVVRGTDWEVPNSVMTDCLVVMTSKDDDGDFAVVWMSAGPRTAAEGMAGRVIRDIEFMEDARRHSGRPDD